MRSNREIRLLGKDSLQGNYLAAIANMLLITFASFGLQTLVGRLTGLGFNYEITGVSVRSNGMEFVHLILSLVISFVLGLLSLGFQWGFLDLQDGEPMTVGHLGLAFQRNTLKSAGYLFIKSFLIFLWSLLLVIPGIVKTYSWAMSDFLYYDNPDVPNKIILDRSEELMRGYRWQLFRMDLFYTFLYFVPLILWGVGFTAVIGSFEMGYDMSAYTMIIVLVFIGLALLAVLSFMMLFVEPKRYAARAAFYTELVEVNE